MKKTGKKSLFAGSAFLALFICWTTLVRIVDVQAIGPHGTCVGFAAWNRWFHDLTGVHMTIYNVTDWLGLVPVFVCMIFAGLGLIQLVRRRNLFQVDYDILILGIYYVIVIFSYLIFEVMSINYRPVLIEGRLEASYPSSTTLLVLCVMPTLAEQAKRRLVSIAAKKWIKMFCMAFSAFMVVGRLISGVHWVTDIVGAVILSAGLFCLYEAAILFGCKERC